MIRAGLVAICAIGLSACSQDDTHAANGGADDRFDYGYTTPLPKVFDCVRENGGIFLAAHRGGPKAGFPENTLEAMMEAYRSGVRVFEVDVQASSDGVLFLLHDDSLARTTTGRTDAADTNWRTISNLPTVDMNGRVTRIRPPELSSVLEWARSSGAILELDKKSNADWAAIIDAVNAAGASNHVIMITYNHGDAQLIHRLAPDLMLSVGLEDNQLPRGVDPTVALAWTGTREPSPGFWRSLRRRGIEPIFGTLGRPDQRLDDVYLVDGDPSEFEDMIEQGLVMLATDRAEELAGLLSEDDDAIETCLN